jgi:5'-nucleotidase
VPALAVSLQTDIAYHYRYGAVDWRAASHFARLFAAAMLRTRLPFDVDLLKVDVPRDATADTPWRVTRASRQSYFSVRMESPAPHNPIGAGKVVVHLDPAAVETDSDIHAIVYDRIVSVTPLTLDLTSRVDRADLDALLRSKAL